MKRKRFSEEQIIKILQAHESGVPLADLAREHGFAEGTIYTWKARYGGRRLRDRQKGVETGRSRIARLDCV